MTLWARMLSNARGQANHNRSDHADNAGSDRERDRQDEELAASETETLKQETLLDETP